MILCVSDECFHLASIAFVRNSSCKNIKYFSMCQLLYELIINCSLKCFLSIKFSTPSN
jgi:hypothetical protein